jgi:hypothetical protein
LREIAGRALNVLPNCLVSVVNAQSFGSEALELTYKDPTGKVGNEATLEVRRAADFDSAFQTAMSARIDALYAVSSRLTAQHFDRIVRFAAEHRLPLAEYRRNDRPRCDLRGPHS